MLKNQMGSSGAMFPSTSTLFSDGDSTRSGIRSSNEVVNFITFNQDATCIALGLNNGYKIFNCKPDFGMCSQLRRNESIGKIEMLYCTSLVAVVGLGEEVGSSPRKLKIINTKRQSTICDLVFPSTIYQVKLSRNRLIVLLEEQIYIYDITSMKLLHTIETSPNVNGICAILAGDEESKRSSYLAYPSPPKTITHDSLLVNGLNTNGGLNSAQNNVQSVSNSPNRVGDVIIFDLNSLQPLSVIEAHKSALAAVTLSHDGSLLATASDKGTIVRVFSVAQGIKLYQFRRGTYPTRIFSLNFSLDNKFVVATSSSGTVHIFRLGEEESLENKHKKNRLSKKAKLNPEYQTIMEELPKKDVTSNATSVVGSNDGNDEGEGDEDDDDDNDMIFQDDGDNSDADDEGHGSDNDDTQDNSTGDIAMKGEDESCAEAKTQQQSVDSKRKNDDTNKDYFNVSANVKKDANKSIEEEPVELIPKKQRKSSLGSSNNNFLLSSFASDDSSILGLQNVKEAKSEPIVDQNRLSVARLIRRSSQSLGRKAAQKMGDFLPSKFSSILEPTRHFASLKINSVSKDVKSTAIINTELQKDLVPLEYIASPETNTFASPRNEFFPTAKEASLNLLHISVVTSEGYFYTYGLDPERGGDCILLQQYFLLE